MYMNDGIKTKINLRSKSVFITGVAGFIGSNLAKRLLSTVEDVKVVGLGFVLLHIHRRISFSKRNRRKNRNRNSQRIQKADKQ